MSETVAARTALRTALRLRQSGVLLFSLTPPRRGESTDRIREIAAVTLRRLDALDLDGLILYDLDDEADRNPAERPFPYLPTLDPGRYHAEYLHGWDREAIIYRCVGKYGERELRTWLAGVDPSQVLSVFVGPSSGDKEVRTGLRRAHELRREVNPGLVTGAVVISERHARRQDEHRRMLTKQELGCDFFVSQVVYDIAATKNLISDYAHECRTRGLDPRPVIFTLSLCGSPRTLEFLSWLGVEVPRWLQQSIRHAGDPLGESFRQVRHIARDLTGFCDHLGVPHGFNIESVSIRKAEIEAATELTAEVAALLNR
ncbi:methylenetetrahydrofolate reductase [Actinoplanes sp. NPDC048988]|uniref:methylenetetrahydrofolate reductase n=1 Tax=Actinoplanes sp. NPDC048988 TaxID=3363901 RepID=UPI00371EE92A